MLYTSLLLSLVAVFVTASSSQTSVLLGRGNSLLGWSTAWNNPSLGNSLSISAGGAVAPWSSLPFFNISFNFTSNVTNNEWLTLDPTYAATLLAADGAQNLTFSVFNPTPARLSIMVTVIDNVNKGHGTSLEVPSAGWNNVSIGFGPNAPWWPANTSFALPLLQLTIGPTRTPPYPTDIGWVGIADVALIITAQPADVPSPLTWFLSQPLPETGGVVQAGSSNDTLHLGVFFQNRLPVSCSVNAIVEMRNATGPMGEGASGSFDTSWQQCAATTTNTSVDAWTAELLSCDIVPLSSPVGYIVMRARLISAVCDGGAGFNETQQQVVEGALLLSPTLPTLKVATSGPNVVAGVFGGQMQFPSPQAALLVGMHSIRTTVAIWKQVQPIECWEDDCFSWGKYDANYFPLASAGLELTICAMEMAPTWASAKNNSGPSWAFIPGIEHYGDFQHFFTLLFQRYGSNAVAVEVMNEVDGLSYFQPDPIPLNGTAIPLTLALTNATAAAMAAAGMPSTSMYGLPTSLFDIKQQWPGGPIYREYEDAVLTAPGMMNSIAGTTPHPYAPETFVPFTFADGRNSSFNFPNETANVGNYLTNSTVTQLLVVAEAMRAAATAAGLGRSYTPKMRVTEFGYALAVPTSATEGWAVVHAAAIAQSLLHMRSAPLAVMVEKAFLFAAYDGCCAQENSFFGVWRPAQARMGPNALLPYTQPHNLPDVMPLPAAAAFATAAANVDIGSGRAAGVFLVDNTASGNIAVNGVLLPSCIAFEAAQAGVAPLVALFITGHHFNDRTTVQITVTARATLQNGLGAQMSFRNQSAGVATVDLASLPQYITLDVGASAESACLSMTW